MTSKWIQEVALSCSKQGGDDVFYEILDVLTAVDDLLRQSVLSLDDSHVGLIDKIEEELQEELEQVNKE